jgi:antitoxin component YwqK of YwqJK toxin-antitoxin module
MKIKLAYLIVFTFLFLFSNVVFGEELEVVREYWGKYLLWGKGNLKKETHYKNGKKEGLTRYWYKSGKKKGERHFKNGKREGPLIWWYESGKKMGEEYYKDGKKNGLGIWWYDNGTKKI